MSPLLSLEQFFILMPLSAGLVTLATPADGKAPSFAAAGIFPPWMITPEGAV